jgi:RNA polymerase sigma-70 factor (ECF subfamily)
MNDREFLSRFRAGEPQVLTEVYWAYNRNVERVLRHGLHLYRVGAGWADLPDLIHEVFVRAFAPAARGSYDGLRPYEGYLLTIARNVLVDWTRRAGREVSVDPSHFERASESDEGEAADTWAQPETIQCVSDYVAGLSEQLRSLHKCRFISGMSQVQAAVALGWSRQQLRTREKELRSGLVQALRRAGLEPPQ